MPLHVIRKNWPDDSAGDLANAPRGQTIEEWTPQLSLRRGIADVVTWEEGKNEWSWKIQWAT